MPSILFVCTANLYRSPLAAAFLKGKSKEIVDQEAWVIESAGTWTKAGSPVHSQTLEDARGYGLDVRAHRSQQVNRELLSRYDLVLVMETGHKEALLIEFPEQSQKIHLLSEVVDGLTYDIPDPFSSEGLHDRDIVNELNRIITRGHKKIFALARGESITRP